MYYYIYMHSFFSILFLSLFQYGFDHFITDSICLLEHRLEKFWVSSNSRLYNSKFPKLMILDQVCAAIVKFKSSCLNEVSLTATSILSSKYPGVQNTYSVTPKILNNGVEQIIWSYGTILNCTNYQQ